MISEKVSVLITGDIDPTPEASLAEKRKALQDTLAAFDGAGVKGTFYIVGNIVSDYEKILAGMKVSGHEIGCHGLTHDESEEFNRLPYETARKHIAEATQKISRITGRPPVSFRAPRVKSSHMTHQALSDLGYLSDSSVCSQRLDFISSNLINLHWLFAPRLPYHPHPESAFRRGHSRLWEIPVSACGLPFISAVLYFFGVDFMMRFFHLLHREARRTGKPIVYLFHPSEFASQTIRIRRKTTLKSVASRGFYFRRHLKLTGSAGERFQKTVQFVKRMSAYPDIEFMTVHEYVKRLNAR